MNQQEYKRVLIDSIDYSYPKWFQREILKEFIHHNVVHNGLFQKIEGMADAVDVSVFPEEDRLKKSLELSDKAVKALEKIEFTKAYKNALLYSYDECDQGLLVENLLANGAREYVCNPEITDTVLDGLDNPTIYKHSRDFLIIKFAKEVLKVSSLAEVSSIKYPVLVVFNFTLKVVEIRFDRINRMFRENDDFHKQIIISVTNWIQSGLNVQLTSIDMEQIVEKIKNECDHVAVHSQLMSLSSGGKATLDVANNRDYVLPILGELKALIAQNQEKFDKCLEIKEILDAFIVDIEETSHLPWVALCWKREKRSQDIVVKFLFNYKNQGVTLLQYMGTIRDMERMNYVTGYLIKNK